MNTEWSGNRWWRILGTGVAALAALAILASLAGIITSSSQGDLARTSPVNDEYTRMMAELDQRAAVSSSANKLTVPPAGLHSSTLSRPVVSAPEPKPVAAVKITTPQNDPGASPAPVIEPILFPALTPAEISEAAAQTPGPPVETVKPPVIAAASTSPIPAPMTDSVIPPAKEVSPGAA
ncbi:MAG TPA: hypothetical protein VK956_15550, partial [Verrucomicrobium sp.]|nr:hypothetical protein [Verrucomicrobium sp.]